MSTETGGWKPLVAWLVGSLVVGLVLVMWVPPFAVQLTWRAQDKRPETQATRSPGPGVRLPETTPVDDDVGDHGSEGEAAVEPDLDDSDGSADDGADGEESGDGGLADAPPSCTLALATFNLEWAHNERSTSWYAARTKVDWDWKADGIAGVLGGLDLDLIVVQEIGGGGESHDIEQRLEKESGRSYAVIQPPSTYGQQVALFYDEDRLALTRDWVFPGYQKQVVAELSWKQGGCGEFTVIGFQLPQRDTNYREPMAQAHGKVAAALTKGVTHESIVGTPAARPVILLGDVGASKYGPLMMTASGGVCRTSSDLPSVTKRGVTSGPIDWIIVCGTGVELMSVEAVEASLVWNFEPDSGEARWSYIPIDAPPYRDLSDHRPLVAKVEIPGEAP